MTGAEPGVEARRLAGALLEGALSGRDGLAAVQAGKGFSALPSPDRAFARACAMGALRRLGEIDLALDSRLKTAPPQQVRTLLRIALAQRWVLDVPAFAAVSSAVKLAEREAKTRPYKALVNAVLRGLERDPAPPAPPQANLPDWIAARWTQSWGPETAAAIAAAVRQEPPTDLSLKPGQDAEALARALEGEVLPGGSVRTRLRGDLTGWPGYADGGWWVQDAAAAVPVRALDPRPGEAVLDLCAAPGGKTLQLAAAGAAVVALDRNAARLRRLQENLTRTGLTAEVVAADAERWDDPRTFDAVLLDAPCTATGTLRRHPEVLHAVRPGDVADLADVQHRLLDAAADRVRPGGRLVYAVCSLEREEGEGQIPAFLRRRPDFRLAAIDPAAVGAPETAAGPQGLRLHPGQWPDRGGLDGFFLARLDRTA
ncbi:RsmB/NOP family class I SAM-dependent RNA methyltransferase [Brevundimonas sp.]|uniref:RsmB/NOP family class I SAM-dependent RNA methyltransferase n=1 Tax=Brevundimonas sp. TaxID=1871086 RepID=UPI00261A23EF|nr:RsmB/NOP family class I SAM-dependent RNA methyltransferase [Brevundimonas sp.]